MRMLKHIVVVIEGLFLLLTLFIHQYCYGNNTILLHTDTFEVRFAMRHCVMTEYDGQYTSFKCHNEPTYLLTRRCGTSGLDHIAVGCKVDESINYLVNLRRDLFDHVKYALISADDVYWRADQLLRWLAVVERSGASNFPVVFSPTASDKLRPGVRDMTNCGEVYTSWQSYPVVLNHVLLQRMSAGAAAYAVREICRSFDAAPGMGVGVLAWMHSADHIHMPNVNWNHKSQGTWVLMPADMAVMYAVHSEREHCGEPGAQEPIDWPDSARYNQSTVLGCGSVGTPAPGHSVADQASMYDVWEYFSANGLDTPVDEPGSTSTEFTDYYVAMKSGRITRILHEANTWVSSLHIAYRYVTGAAIDHAGAYYTLAEGEKIIKRRMPRMVPLRGYADTKHGKANNITNTWKAFTPQDCSPAGHKRKKS